MKCKLNEKSSKILWVVVLSLLIFKPVWAQEWIQNIKNPEMPMSFQFSGYSLGDASAKNYSDEIATDTVNAKAVIPISRNLDFKQSISLDFNQTTIDQTNKSPTSPIPDKLTDEKLGYQFIVKKNDQEYWGMNSQVGSASDKPFFNWSVTEVSLTSFYYKESNAESSWVYLLNYSNQRSFLPNIPLPGFMYLYNNQKGFSLYAGIPVFGIVYFPSPKWMINYFSVLPWMHQFKVTYFVTRPVQIYFEFKSIPELFKPVDYVENEDRIIIEDQKAILGTKFPITEDLSLDIHSGYSFNRKISQAKRPGAKEDWKEEIGNQSFFNIQLLVKF